MSLQRFVSLSITISFALCMIGSLPTTVKAATGLVTGEEIDMVFTKRQTKKAGKISKKRRNDAADPSDALGTIYGSLLLSVSRNPTLADELIKLAAFGHASVIGGEDLEHIPALFDEIGEAMNMTNMLGF